jgi:hypothetical protein
MQREAMLSMAFQR